MLPIMVELATFANNDLIPALRGIGSAAGENFDAAVSGLERFWDTVTGKKDDVLRVAEAMGVSYAEARDAIVTANDEMGLSAEEVASRLENGLPTTKAALDEQHEEVGKSIDELIAMYRTADTTSAAEAMQQKIIDAIHDSWDEIRQAGADTVREYNAGLFEGQASLQTQIEGLLEALETNLAPADEIALLRGQKVDLMLARGIAEAKGDLGAVAAIDNMLGAINTRLNALNGYASGRNIVRTLADGMNDRAANAYLSATANAVGGRIRRPLAIFSEPEDPSSPLAGITKWGGNIAKTIAGGMLHDEGVLQHAAARLASDVRNALASPLAAAGPLRPIAMASAGSAVIGGGAGGGTVGGTTPIVVQSHLYLDGREITAAVDYEHALTPPADSIFPV